MKTRGRLIETLANGCREAQIVSQTYGDNKMKTRMQDVIQASHLDKAEQQHLSKLCYENGTLRMLWKLWECKK